jgi:hypothetical protein
MRGGYGYKIVQENIAESVNAGEDSVIAVKEAYALARRSFFRAHPTMPLPQWLAWPRGYRSRFHYDSAGRPKAHYPMLKNPREPVHELEQAKELFEAFAEKPAGRVKVFKVNVPKAGLVFGKLVQIGYISEYDGKPYRHTFEKAGSRPLLVAAHDGKSVVIVGGRYAFTERGIEDR